MYIHRRLITGSLVGALLIAALLVSIGRNTGFQAQQPIVKPGHGMLTDFQPIVKPGHGTLTDFQPIVKPGHGTLAISRPLGDS